MKTVLEWVSYKDRNANKEEAKGRPVIFRYKINNVLFIKVCSGDEIVSCPKHLTEAIDWAYVNLPQEEVKIKVSSGELPKLQPCDSCWKCGTTENLYNKLKHVCKKCNGEEKKETISRSPEARERPTVKDYFDAGLIPEGLRKEFVKDDEGWIWPLKRVPEEGQEVEVKRLSFERDFKSVFDGEFFLEFDNDEKTIHDVIAWRPLREGKKPEDKKPDFSKLREGDFVVVSLLNVGVENKIVDLVGYFRTSSWDTFYFSRLKNGFDVCEKLKKDIKKIIRINIDRESSIKLPGQLKTGNYPFEEI